MPSFNSLIENWTEDDLQPANLPPENENYEYKSSKAKDDLKSKIGKAASAFWNAGGGVFIAGIDETTRQIDGGIPVSHFGRQSPRDWVDRVLSGVQPVGPYNIKIVERTQPTSAITQGCVIIVIEFGLSPLAPHMALDNIYYIRLGAHSDRASHFIVEALFARRSLQNPQLHCLVQIDEKVQKYLELKIFTLNNAPVFNVEIFIEPLPKYLSSEDIKLPICVSLINSDNQFMLILGRIIFTQDGFITKINENIVVRINYEDSKGTAFCLEQKFDIPNILKISPRITSNTDNLVKAIDNISKKIDDLTQKMKK